MITTADVVRELIDGMIGRLQLRGYNLRSGDDERMEALWIEIESHLNAADLCEILQDQDEVERHLDKVNQLLNQVLEALDD